MKAVIFSAIILLTCSSLCGQSALQLCAKDYEEALRVWSENRDSADLEKPLKTLRENWLACLPGKEIPEMNFTTVKGIKIDNAFLTNKVVLLQFWSQWCPPCMAEISMINKLVKECGRENIIFITLAANASVEPQFKNRFLSHFVINQAETSKNFGVFGYPAIYVISKTKKIVAVYRGAGLDENDELLLKIKKTLISELDR